MTNNKQPFIPFFIRNSTSEDVISNIEDITELSDSLIKIISVFDPKTIEKQKKEDLKNKTKVDNIYHVGTANIASIKKSILFFEELEKTDEASTFYLKDYISWLKETVISFENLVILNKQHFPYNPRILKHMMEIKDLILINCYALPTIAYCNSVLESGED